MWAATFPIKRRQLKVVLLDDEVRHDVVVPILSEETPLILILPSSTLAPA